MLTMRQSLLSGCFVKMNLFVLFKISHEEVSGVPADKYISSGELDRTKDLTYFNSLA